MKLICFAIFISCIMHTTANSQADSSSNLDFSGIYAPPVFVGTVPVSEPDIYPFTTEGQQTFNAYDPLDDSPSQTNDCSPDLMPGILWSNSPMQLLQEKDRIIISYERGNTTRTILMDELSSYADQSYTDLGHSLGSWIDNVLTIKTIFLSSKTIRNNRGYPISPNAQVTERYWRALGENNLQMELIINDPINYTQPFKLSRAWIWAPHEELQEYECINLGPRDETPNIDELTRMLENL
jgi:hypothetical protein